MLPLDIFIWFLVGVQFGCLVISMIKGVNPWEVLGGFAIWGVIPVLILNML